MFKISNAQDNTISSNLYIIQPCLKYEVLNPSSLDMYEKRNIGYQTWIPKLSMASGEVISILYKKGSYVLASDLFGRTLILKNASDCLLKVPNNGYIVRVKETLKFVTGEVLYAGADYWSVGGVFENCKDISGFCEKILYYNESYITVPRSNLDFFPTYNNKLVKTEEKRPE